MESPELTSGMAEAFAQAGQAVLVYLPNAITAMVIALLGWLAAVSLRKLARYLASHTQQKINRISWLQNRTQQVPLYRATPALIAGLVFWTVLLFFLVAAVEALRLPAVSGLLARITRYLPRVLAGVLIIWAGWVSGDILRRVTSGALDRVGLARSETLARLIQILVVVVAGIIGIEQLGVDSTMLILVSSMLLGAILGAVALAFGLGARGMVSDVLGIQQLAKLYRVGDRVRIGETEGAIVEFTQTVVILDAPAGKIMIPGRRLADEISVRTEEGH